MNLVTREQFEIQEKVLHRTRARLLELEKQVVELEKHLNPAADEKANEAGNLGAELAYNPRRRRILRR